MVWCLSLAILSLIISQGADGRRKPEVVSVIGRAGESAVLGCDLLPPAGRPPLHVIEWLRFGFLLPIFIQFGLYSPRIDPNYVGRVQLHTGASLRIEGLRVEDQGWYECRVLLLDQHSPEEDFANGSWVHLTVNSPPQFQETPPPVLEVQELEPVTLHCVARGSPQPHVTWKLQGEDLGQGRGQVQVQNGTLWIRRVERSSSGVYTCQASSTEGSATYSTELLVLGPPVIVVPPKNSTVNASQDVSLACRAEAYPANLTYSWFLDGINVFHISRLQSRVRILVDGSLRLQAAQPDDAGHYTCVPSNGLLHPPSASAYLTVLYPAQVTVMPPETPLPIGMQGVIRCPVRANPPLLFVSWTKDGQALQLDKFPGWSQGTEGSLIIALGNEDALGEYSCTPYNSLGTAGPSPVTRVLLKAPPAFIERPKEEYFQEVGRELLIPCSAQGDPPPTVSWAKVGRGLRGQIQVDHNSSLILRPLTKEAHGRWECSASNSVARVAATTDVYVLGTSPHVVTNVSVVPLPKGANVSWEPGFDGGYLQRFSVWYTPLAKRPDRAHHDWLSLAVPVGAVYLLVPGLQPHTQYQFSVLAQNKLGSGPFSEIVLSAPEELIPKRLDGYVLEGRQGSQGWEVLDRAVAGTEMQLLVPGLIKDVLYEFRLVAFAGSYVSDPSNTANVSTSGLEVYPSRTQLPGLLPQPVLAGVVGGVCFLGVAVLVSILAACFMNRRRAARRRRKRLRQDPPLIFSPPRKSVPHSAPGSSSPDSVAKLKLQGSPLPSLRQSLLWGEPARPPSPHLDPPPKRGPLPLEPICRGPDGRFVMGPTVGVPQERSELERAEPRTPAQRLARSFDCSSSSPSGAPQPLCIADISPVGSPPAVPPSPLPAPSAGGSYLSPAPGDTSSWASGPERWSRREHVVTVSKRRNTSVDENYEWDSEFPGDMELLETLHLGLGSSRLQPEAEPELGGKTPEEGCLLNTAQVPGPEARCAALREEFLAFRRRRDATRARLPAYRQPVSHPEQATLL
ncbi:Protein turtle-like protein A [Sciurus carolinensis]|uniref:Protein turtle-like protein A n=1 Tax=Sciurus carolinensis TaxID=30640 RepID=A0AA41NJV1_SCICA|nr:Protein turtle-like protein A [Sciurus carolinensis]